MTDSDIKAVYEALVGNMLQYSNIFNQYYCAECYSTEIENGKVKHRPACPVLIAEKLLEGMK